MHLSAHLLAAFSDAVLKIHTPVPFEELPNLYLEVLGGLIDCEHLSYNEFGPDHVRAIIVPEITAEYMGHFARLIDQHPGVRHITQTGHAEAVKISDFVTQAEWHRAPLFNEFFRPLRIHHQLGFMFSVGEMQFGFAANRMVRDFSESDRVLLTLLQPHFQQAYLNAKALARVQRSVDAHGSGTITFSSNGKILFSSPKARDAVERFFGASGNENLPEKLHAWATSGLKRTSAEALCAGPRRSLTIEGQESILTVRLSPDFATREHLLVLEEEVRAQPISVFTEFGHSKRESEVLSWVMQGKTNPEIAKILGISPRTVAHHVERILSRIGVESRGSAAYWAQEKLRVFRSGAA